MVHASDNLYSFGSASLRASVVYAATGAINTSDAAAKKIRGEPSEPEIRAWARVRPKVFQWNAAVAAKGDEGARLHLGYVAQEVAAAFRAEGLDPERYALFCSDEIMETRPVSQTRLVTRPVTRRTRRRREEIEICAGQPVLRIREDDIDEPVVRDVTVCDEAGETVLDAAGQPMTHPVTEVETVEITEIKDTEVPTGEKRHGLRYDQCLVMEIAYLRSRLGVTDAGDAPS